MTWLSLLLITKILVSVVLIIIPFMFFPKSKLDAMTRMKTDTTQFYRLYGIAILALLVAYGSGIPLAQQGEFPWGIVLMGIVSNIGGGAALLAYGVDARNGTLGAIFLAIGAGLILSAWQPELALSKV